MRKAVFMFVSNKDVREWQSIPREVLGNDLFRFIETLEFAVAHGNGINIYSDADYIELENLQYMPVIVVTNEQLAEWYELDEDVIGSSLFEFIGDITTQLDMGGIVKVWPDDNYFTES